MNHRHEAPNISVAQDHAELCLYSFSIAIVIWGNCMSLLHDAIISWMIGFLLHDAIGILNDRFHQHFDDLSLSPRHHPFKSFPCHDAKDLHHILEGCCLSLALRRINDI